MSTSPNTDPGTGTGDQAAGELPLYERPSLVRHQMGQMNKFGRAQGVRPLTHIDDVAVEELVAKFGSPLFVFSEKTLIARYRELHQAFSRRYPKVRIAWSYKTNYLQAICRVFHREGAWAEVVSPMEFDKARRTGIPADHIHFNGPFKPDDALAEAVQGEALLHIDNLDELVRLERLADRLGVRPRVAIRVNLAVEGLPAWSRFGLNLESGQAREAAVRIIAGGKLDLVGLHCHIGTFIVAPVAYGIASAKLVDFAQTDERFAHLIRHGRSRLVGDAMPLIKEAMVEGLIPEGDPEQLAYAILGVSTNLTAVYINEQGQDPDAIAQVAVDFCLRGIGAR